MPSFSLRKFLARVRALPVTIHDIKRILTDSIPAVEELTGALKLVATHMPMPVMGNVYSIIVWEEEKGAFAERQAMRNALVKELGEPITEDELDDGCRLSFRSENQRLPRSHAHKVLGDVCLAKHCAALTKKERAAVDESLVAMELFLRDAEGKTRAVTAILLHRITSERIPLVIGVIQNITRDFARKNQGSQDGSQTPNRSA
jgi:hypothetical protein